MIKVNCEVNGCEKSKDLPPIYISSHWNYQDLINISLNGEEYTVNGNDLIAAIKKRYEY